jgi:hypothetical protein
MDKERSSFITIDGTEYALTLTTRATKEIASRHGGLDALGDKLFNADKADSALSEVVWLICTLANQSIMAENLRNRNMPPRELLTTDTIELLTTPYDLAGFKDAILESIYKGTKREIESADEPRPANPPKE